MTSQNDLAKQVAGFQQFIQDPEVNVIVMSPLEVTGWEQVLKDAKAAGKPVILSDRRIDGFEDYYVTFIGADFVEEGRKAGTEMCKLLEGSEKKIVWELVGNVGAAPAIDRGKGFRETAAECGIKVTKSQTANWSVSEGKQVTEAWLKETKDVQGIFGQNDEMAFGAIEALKEAGLVPARGCQGHLRRRHLRRFPGHARWHPERDGRMQPAAGPAGLRSRSGRPEWRDAAQVDPLAGKRLLRRRSEPEGDRRRSQVLVP